MAAGRRETSRVVVLNADMVVWRGVARHRKRLMSRRDQRPAIKLAMRLGLSAAATLSMGLPNGGGDWTAQIGFKFTCPSLIRSALSARPVDIWTFVVCALRCRFQSRWLPDAMPSFNHEDSWRFRSFLFAGNTAIVLLTLLTIRCTCCSHGSSSSGTELSQKRQPSHFMYILFVPIVESMVEYPIFISIAFTSTQHPK